MLELELIGAHLGDVDERVGVVENFPSIVSHFRPLYVFHAGVVELILLILLHELLFGPALEMRGAHEHKRITRGL